MPKIVCTDCKTEFAPLENGVVVIETAFDPPQPYKLWEADALKCKGCNKVIIGGFANRPFAIHHQPDFESVLEKTLEKRTVFYDHEKPFEPSSVERHALEQTTKALLEQMSVQDALGNDSFVNHAILTACIMLGRSSWAEYLLCHKAASGIVFDHDYDISMVDMLESIGVDVPDKMRGDDPARELVEARAKLTGGLVCEQEDGDGD